MAYLGFLVVHSASPLCTDVSGNCGIAGWKDMKGSEGWERIPDFFAAAGDIQAKLTRVSGGLDLLGLYIFFLAMSL